MVAADKYGKSLGEMKEDAKVLSYSLELSEKREQKLGAELEDWNLKAGKEIEDSLSGNRQRLNIIEEELSIFNKKKNNFSNCVFIFQKIVKFYSFFLLYACYIILDSNFGTSI